MAYAMQENAILHKPYELSSQFRCDGSDGYISFLNNLLELNNYCSIKKLDGNIKNYLIYTSNKYRLGNICFCRSSFREGRIVSIADKIVSFRNFKNVNFQGLQSLITGKNKNLKK